METKKNRNTNACEPSHSYENLTLLLKNEYNRQNVKSKSKGLKEPKKADKKQGTKELKVTKSRNENSLDLVINVELRKHEANYMDAYFTDMDLQGRKAYHESMAKQDSFNRSQFSELNLIFSDEATESLSSENRNLYLNGGNTSCCSTDDISLETLFGKGCTKTFYNSSYQVDKECHKYSYQSNESKQYGRWSPLHYKAFPNINLSENYDTLKTYETRKLETRRTKFDHVFSDCGASSEISLEFIRKETKFKRNCYAVPPLKLNNCNTFPSLKNAFSMWDDSSRATEDCESNISHNRLENIAITFSDPEINFDRGRYKKERLEYHQICSTIAFSESSVRGPSSLMFDVYSDRNCTNPSRMFLESQFYKENVYEFDQEDVSRILLRQNSLFTNIRRDKEVKYNSKHYKDICYLEKKYAREQNANKNESCVENAELLTILKVHDSSLLNFDFVKAKEDLALGNSIEKKSTDDIVPDDEIVESEWLNSKIESQNNTALGKISTTDNTTNKKKTLEVLFPVKSLRTCVDNVDGDKAADMNVTNEVLVVDEPSVKSIIEVEITKKTVLSTFKSMELITDCRSKCLSTDDSYTISKDDNCEISKDDINIKLFNGTVIAGNYSDDNVCCDTFDIKMILNSKEFKEEVLNIIESYLEDNYLKDDDFEVVIVPKNDTCSRNSNPIDVLKAIIKQKLNQNEYEMDTNRMRQHDLSTFNPRDFKGYVMKYEKMYNDSPTIRSTYKSTKRKQFHDEISHNPYKTTLLVRPSTVKTMDSYTGKSHKTLSKHLSMPVFKLKSTSSIKIRNQFGKSVYQNYKSFGEHKDHSTTLIVAKREPPESNIFNQYIPYFMNTNIFAEHNMVKDRSLRSRKKKSKQDKCEFFSEFKELKQIFDQVEVKHDALIHALNYDPCGLLFKIKRAQYVATRRK